MTAVKASDRQKTTGVNSYKNFRAITAGTTLLSPRIQLLYVGVAGSITIENSNGDTVTFNAIAGWYPAEISRVTAAAATDIVGFW